MSVTCRPFGVLPGGEQVDRYTIRNRSGAYVEISTLGCAIVSLFIPDAKGNLRDIVLGYDTPEEYCSKPKFIGVVIGRYANRIAGGRYSLEGNTYQLECNSNGNALHGGSNGFDKRLWSVVDLTDNSICLALESPDGDAGYPGTLRVRLRYTFTDDNALYLHYQAESDAPTVCNLTHHCYFNLAGHDTADISAQTLCIYADFITEVDNRLIPTGRFLPVSGTPYDLNHPVSFGNIHTHIGTDPQITIGKGLDFNYVLRGNGLRKIGEARDPESGRIMSVFTDMPGVQAYSGGNLNDQVLGKGGQAYPQHAAFCLETQFFPDSPNQPGFPSTVLRPGELYDHTTVYKFSTE